MSEPAWENRFRPHSKKQELLATSDAPLTVAAVGTQWGKSMAAAAWMKRQIHIFDQVDDNFLLLAPNYKIMQQSMLPYFLNCMEGFGVYHKVDAVFKIYNGGTVYLRTGTDADSIVGIPKVRAFWLDEAGKVSLYFWEQIQTRAAAQGARGLLTTSPYSLNWIFKDIITPKKKGLLKEVELIQGASWENPFHSTFDVEVREKIRRQMDERRFNMNFGGIWDRMQGQVYDCWDEAENEVDAFNLPQGTRFVAGVDWGHQDPFVILVRAITPDGRHYGVSEFYQSGLSPVDWVNVAKRKQQVFDIDMFYCDPSKPEMILEFNRNKLPAIGADNSITLGIGLHYELIKSRRYKEFRGLMPKTHDERAAYHYPEPKELNEDQNAKETKPVDKDNHGMDAERYLTISTYRSHQRAQPKVPDIINADKKLTHDERLAKLKKFRRNPQTEKWS